ncbi:MAG: amino acid racemase [Balneolaceae bacterium]|jgi:aspartate racemase
MDKPVIGILAGMGPRSTSPFLEKVLDQCQVQLGASDDMDFPPIVIYSLPTPFYVDRPINHEEMASTIKMGLQDLEKTGVAFISMPCNSAHRYFDELSDSITIPLLNMIDMTVQDLPDNSKTIAVLGTETTIEMNLYQDKIKKKGSEPFHDSQVQQQINNILMDVKSHNDIHSARRRWETLTSYLIKNKVDSLLLACTDLQPVVTNNSSKELPYLDAADCLAKNTVIQWQKSCQKLGSNTSKGKSFYNY